MPSWSSASPLIYKLKEARFVKLKEARFVVPVIFWTHPAELLKRKCFKHKSQCNVIMFYEIPLLYEIDTEVWEV